MTIQENASKLLAGMKHETRGDKTIALISDGELHDSLLDLTFEVSHQANLSMDSVYQFTYEALQALSDSDNGEDAIYEIEADVYTGELTAWLAENVNHVSYLDEAIENCSDEKTGFALLQYAQQLAKQEVARIIYSELEKISDR